MLQDCVMLFLFGVVYSLLLSVAFAIPSSTRSSTLYVPNDHPLIFYHGRWDKAPATWWTGSGFKLNIQDLSSITLNFGVNTTQPLVPVGISIDFGPFFTVNMSIGANPLPLNSTSMGKTTVLRFNSEGWQDNRINLESITLNSEARLLPYIPSKLTFQVIGDSLSAGQYLPMGVDQAWPFLTGEAFKAEHHINAQPGITLTDMLSYGNVHGMTFQYFRTEDTGYYYTADHNYTTPWIFTNDHPQPTHLVVHIGANDASWNVTDDAFVETYTQFLLRLRTIYTHQPMFIFTPWGWPSSDGSVFYYYPGQYQIVVNNRIKAGDHNVFLVNTTGWVTWDDVFPDNQHPSVAGHQKIAGLFEAWLENWGLQPEKQWATPASGI